MTRRLDVLNIADPGQKPRPAMPSGFSLKLLYRGSAALMYDESYRIYQIERTEEATEKQASAPSVPHLTP